MNPILITNIPLLKAAFLLLMVIGFAHTSRTENCDTKVVKAVSISNECSKRFLRVNGSEVKADSKVDYILYTITHWKSTAFFLFDPQQSKFICFRNKRGKKMFVAKRIPKAFNQCLFEETPALQISYTTPYTMYKLYNKNATQPNTVSTDASLRKDYYLSFNKDGVQKVRKKKCHRRNNIFLKKKQTGAACEVYHKDFCAKMSKLHHTLHNHIPTELLQHCKLTKS